MRRLLTAILLTALAVAPALAQSKAMKTVDASDCSILACTATSTARYCIETVVLPNTIWICNVGAGFYSTPLAGGVGPQSANGRVLVDQSGLIWGDSALTYDTVNDILGVNQINIGAGGLFTSTPVFFGDAVTVTGSITANLNGGTISVGAAAGASDANSFYYDTSGNDAALVFVASVKRWYTSGINVIRIDPVSTKPASCAVGDYYIDNTGTVAFCVCITTGTPGTWRDTVAGATPGNCT
jgi:hypothetical protein